MRLPAEVRAKVLKVDTAAGKLSLGLKPSYFVDEDESMESEAEDEAEVELDEELAQHFDAATAATGQVSCTMRSVAVRVLLYSFCTGNRYWLL